MVIQISLRAWSVDITMIESREKETMPEQMEALTLQAYKKNFKRCMALPNITKFLITVKWIKRLALAILRAQKKPTGFFQVEGVLVNRAEALVPKTD